MFWSMSGYVLLFLRLVDSNFPVSSILVSLLGYGNSVGYIQILVGVLSLIIQMEYTWIR